MQLWRILLLVLLVVLLIPTVRLMNQVKQLESDKRKAVPDTLTAKKQQLKWMQRLLIAVFIVTLVATMITVYLPLFQSKLGS